MKRGICDEFQQTVLHWTHVIGLAAVMAGLVFKLHPMIVESRSEVEELKAKVEHLEWKAELADRRLGQFIRWSGAEGGK